ncbi:unnamed protein product [Clonostachys byssicola]|uniref:Uncharacterized protein n=1 Tax=Clonostachys byssicola TaxID=160290 RepID=A0A9N9XXE9_9HYPO|nr:unnamed protein product [Clonostachys byssicola]
MDIVITTHGYVRQRFTDSTNYKAWFYMKDLIPQKYLAVQQAKPTSPFGMDVYDQMVLLSGGQAFRNIKGGFYNTPQKAVDDPSSPVNQFMKILLSATIIARPKSTLNLPPMVRHEVQVNFIGCWSQLETIRGLVV